MRTAGGAVAASGIMSRVGAQESGTVDPVPETKTGGGVPEYQKPWSALRAFNYQPSYAAHGLEIWNRLEDELETIDSEVASGKEHFPGITALRIWLSWDAFKATPTRYADKLGKLLDVLGRYDLKAMPVLHNGWFGIPYFGGISSTYYRKWRKRPDWWGRPALDYINEVVKPFARDPRILCWDLCNEPQGSGIGVDFFKVQYDRCKELGAVAPITIGNQPGVGNLRAMNAVSDVLSTHPYRAKGKDLQAMVDFARSVKKPIIATECCWGDMDDKKRRAHIHNDLSKLKAAGVGFMPHLLCHTKVADGHRPGKLSYTGPSTYMAFIEADGSLRPEHGIYNDY